MKENWYAFLICIMRTDFTIDRSTHFMLDGKLVKRLRKEGIEEMVCMRNKGMMYKDIGEIFGLSADAVYRRIKRFKEATVA